MITTLFTALPLKVVYVGLSPLIADRIVFIFAGLAVNSIMIQLKAKELSSDPELKASPGWYTKWKRRHAISMRSKTTLAQRLPADMEDKVVELIKQAYFLVKNGASYKWINTVLAY